MIKLKKFQKEGVKIITQHNGTVLLADDMRLGKTVQTLKWISKNKSKSPIIIVCPSIAKWEWHDQAKEHYGINTIVLEGEKPNKRELKKGSIFIINYEILHHWVEILKLMNPQTIILDEVHFIKNPKTIRTKATRRLSKGFVYKEDKRIRETITKKFKHSKRNKISNRLKKRCKHIIAISGTPLVSRPAELYTTLNILWPDVFNSYTKFGTAYCNPTFNHGKLEYKGAVNLDKLHKKLKKLGMIRRLKKDVIKDYKEPTEQVIPVSLKSPNKYKHRQASLLRQMKHHNKKDKHGGFLKLQQIAASMKLDLVLEWIDNFLETSDEKLVVFAHHKKIIKALKDHYPKMSVVVDGSTPTKKKVEAQKKFKNSKSIRVFIGNIKACGMAISLKSANTIVFAEMPLTPGDLNQCKDRIFDITKKEPLFIFYIIAKGTIEEVVCKILQRKQKIINEVMDGSNGVSLNLYNKLEKALLGKQHE